MKWAPSVTVAAVIEQGGRFLLVEEHAEGRRVVNQPAGHLEAGESVVDAAVRETLEETGRDFTPSALLGVYRWVHQPTQRTFVRLSLIGTCGERDATRALDKDILANLWLSRDEVLGGTHTPRSPLVVRCIDDYCAGKRYPLDLYNDVVELP